MSSPFDPYYNAVPPGGYAPDEDEERARIRRHATEGDQS